MFQHKRLVPLLPEKQQESMLRLQVYLAIRFSIITIGSYNKSPFFRLEDLWSSTYRLIKKTMELKTMPHICQLEQKYAKQFC